MNTESPNKHTSLVASDDEQHNLVQKRGFLNNYKFSLDRFFLSHPTFATTFIAMCLASVWLTAWLILLFFSTYATNSTTTAHILIAGLLLSTIAEGLVRYVEDSSLISRWGTGELQRTGNHISLGWTLALFFGGILLVLNIQDFVALPPPEEFTLQAPPEDHSLYDMAFAWVKEFSESSAATWSVFSCWILRIFIYKRSHRTYRWMQTQQLASQFDHSRHP